ncbi:hypothetical protein DFR50_12585 [Roseiarcus fermentans]|uniref:Uncharacterized protein n=1 Tax=Roseiarcus fermentans TaxID=1473586 RepID=A0A366F1R2_9HYPH|nr:hypothetical protein [Roseiarcus fermentans]RBP08603.1 hypothetical protein DFR50_12585 [Roseiarcus fermentans]
MPTRDSRRGRGPALTFAVAWAALATGAAAPAVASDRSTCRYFSQLPDDCADAEQRKFDNLRGYRFEEIDLLARDVIKKVLYVSIYNTTGQNGGDETRDSAPEDAAGRVDPKKVAKQFQALSVQLSPPRYWALDWFADRVGAVRSFDGLDAAWMGNGAAAESRLSAKTPPERYHYQAFPRTAIEGFRKGGKVYVLDDPKGRAWVLSAFTAKATPNENDDDLASLGDRLKLPAGWKFRAVTLDRDLTLEARSGPSAAIEDELGDVYHLAGPGQSNFTP